MRWTAVVNPTAGRGRTRKLLPRLTTELAAHHLSVHVSTSADDGRRVAREAFAAGNGVVVCGGDGTVSEIADEARTAGGTIAVVPTGAGNDFARHLGLDSKQPFDAIDLLHTGRIGITDLGLVHTADGANGSFTTIANTGFDAEANRWANGVRWATGTPLYVLAVFRTLAKYRPQPVRLEVDDVAWEGKAWLVAIGNSRYYAGGMMITPGAEVDDGRLDVCVIGDMSAARLLWTFPRVFSGRHMQRRGFQTFRGARVTIASEGASIPMELWASGERVGPLPAEVDVLAAALRVLVPRDSPVRAT